MLKHERAVRALASLHGLEVRRSRSGHLHLVRADGSIAAVAALTPSDRRGLKNLAAQLRRGGN